MAKEHRHALLKGFELDGYRIKSVLGAGGFGITYLAEQTSIGRSVAIKEYLPTGIAARARDDVSVEPVSEDDRADYDYGLAKFREEAKTLVTFDHPNIVTVYDFREANGTAYLIMQYVEGETLQAILKRDKTLPEDEIREILDPILDGLDQVHKAEFLHRDIKPDNIVIRKDGVPMLIDFGAARLALGEKSKSLTAIVTPGYAPFEQYTSRGNQGPWSDIYAMGAVIYRCITGDAPPHATDRMRHDPYVPASEATGKDYSAALLAATDAALEVDEEDRPQSISDFRKVFNGGRATQPPPMALKETRPPPTSPHPVTTADGEQISVVKIGDEKSNKIQEFSILNNGERKFRFHSIITIVMLLIFTLLTYISGDNILGFAIYTCIMLALIIFSYNGKKWAIIIYSSLLIIVGLLLIIITVGSVEIFFASGGRKEYPVISLIVPATGCQFLVSACFMLVSKEIRAFLKDRVSVR